MSNRVRGRVALLAVALLAPAPAARAQGEAQIQIGMVQGMFRDVQPKLVQAMSKPLRDIIQKQTGLSGEVDIAPDANTLAERMRAKRYQLGVFHGFEFAWLQKANPELVPLVVTVPPARKFQAVVVVAKDSPLKSLADLKDDSILIPRGTKAHCLLYLDAQRARLPATTAKPQTKPALTSEEAIDAVVQGDNAAALVDVSAWLGYQKLQPGAVKQLRVLCESEDFPPTVIAYRKGTLDEATVTGIRKLLIEAHATPSGKPLMMLWNLRGFEDVPADYGEQLDKIAKSYPAPAPPAVTKTVGAEK